MATKIDLIVTEIAAQQLSAALAAEGKLDHAIRVMARRFGPSRVEYGLDFAAPAERQPSDIEVLAPSSIKVWVDPDSARHLKGATIDYQDGPQGSGFKFSNPIIEKGFEDPVAQKFNQLLEDEINPNIASHGGWVQLLDYNDGTAFVQMGGGCQGCGMANVTLRQGIETRVKELLPEVKQIIDSTDHASGSNPYYQPSAK